MIELSQVRCFVAVAEELHFGRAAHRLNMTQPPLSRQIQILERVLGVKLLERTSRIVQLTPAGRAFLQDARRIVRLAERAVLTSRRAAAGESGSLAIGFTAASSYSFVPGLIGRIREKLPNVELTLREMVTSEQAEALLSGGIDVGLLRPPVNRREFESIRVLSERLVLAYPDRDDLTFAVPRSLAELDDVPLIMYAPDVARYFYDLLMGLFNANSIQPRGVQHVAQIHSMLALVRAGLGVALVPEGAQSLRLKGVRFAPLPEAEQSRVELHMAWRKENDSPILAALVEEARIDAASNGSDRSRSRIARSRL